jgi:hypothetical protein
MKYLLLEALIRISIAFRNGGPGNLAAVFVWRPVDLYRLPPGVILCLIAGAMNAWVLLVEIVR